MSGVLLDSTVLIDLLNGVGAARAIVRAEASASLSIITWIEVMVGARSDREESTARGYLAHFRVAQLSAEIAEETVRVRRASALKLPDAIILATARAEGLTLLTRNTKDFSEDDPTIRIPYRL